MSRRRIARLDPFPWNCDAGRHHVITNDRICVLCGARDVDEAPPLPHEPTSPTPTRALQSADIVDITEPRRHA